MLPILHLKGFVFDDVLFIIQYVIQISFTVILKSAHNHLSQFPKFQNCPIPLRPPPDPDDENTIEVNRIDFTNIGPY